MSNIEEILEQLRHSDPAIRSKAVIELSRTDFWVPELFTTALYDIDAKVRLAAATAIGNLGIKSAIQSLIDTLQDTDNDVRETSLWAISKIGDHKAIQDIRNFLQDDLPRIRVTAAYALVFLGSDEMLAITIIIKHLKELYREDIDDYNADLAYLHANVPHDIFTKITNMLQTA